MQNEQTMKTLENIYQQNRIDTCAMNPDGIDYRTSNQEIWDALTEYLTDYFQEDGWSLYYAMNEVLYMGLTEPEQIIAMKIVLKMYR